MTGVEQRRQPRLRREMRARLSVLDLSVPEYTTLSVLQCRPELSNAQLGRRALITPQAMIEVLSNLEQRRFVRRKGGKDKRVLRAELTTAGERLLHEADPLVHDIEREILADISEAGRQVLLDGLLRAMTRLSDGAGSG